MNESCEPDEDFLRKFDHLELEETVAEQRKFDPSKFDDAVVIPKHREMERSEY